MKSMKSRIVSFVLILGMLATPLAALDQNSDLFSNIDYTKGKEIRVILEGNQLDFDVAPRIINGRVLVPMRKIFEAFGLSVTWDVALRAARGKNATMDIIFPIGSTKVEINGAQFELDVPAQIVNGSTMLPLRFLSEYMGYNIVWNSDAQLILLSKELIIEWRYGGFEPVEPFKEYEINYINGYKTNDIRYTGTNHDVAFVNLYKKDGSLIQRLPDFKVKDYVASWTQKSAFANKTYWVHIDELTKAVQTNPIYLEQGLQQLKLNDIKATADVGNYVKMQINQHYFDLQAWKKVIGTPNSLLNAMVDEKLLDGKVIEPNDTLFQVLINDKYTAVVAFSTLNQAVFNRDANKLYTILEESPATLFKWDAITWQRLAEKIPWTGMTQDMLLVQFKMKPDQSSKLITKFNDIEIWVYTEDYGDSIYYFKDKILTNIL